jgi:hypothetical protein
MPAKAGTISEIHRFAAGLGRRPGVQRAGLFDEAPAPKSVSTAPVRVERFEVA